MTLNQANGRQVEVGGCTNLDEVELASLHGSADRRRARRVALVHVEASLGQHLHRGRAPAGHGQVQRVQARAGIVERLGTPELAPIGQHTRTQSVEAARARHSAPPPTTKNVDEMR